MTDDLVDTDADTLRESVVIERRRVRVPLDALFVADPVELVTGDSRSDVGCRCVQNLPRQLRMSYADITRRPSQAHPADLSHRLDLLLVQRLDVSLTDHLARRHARCCH